MTRKLSPDQVAAELDAIGDALISVDRRLNAVWPSLNAAEQKLIDTAPFADAFAFARALKDIAARMETQEAVNA